MTPNILLAASLSGGAVGYVWPEKRRVIVANPETVVSIGGLTSQVVLACWASLLRDFWRRATDPIYRTPRAGGNRR